jgi:hypothetical protein
VIDGYVFIGHEQTVLSGGAYIWSAMSHGTRCAADTEAPLASPLVAPVDPELREELLTSIDERGQVTVRCHFSQPVLSFVRIWRSTYLICRQSGHRSELVHAEGVPYAPHWLPVLPGTPFQFVLVFAPLPRSCAVFDLVEEIPQAGGFVVEAIARNERDLYEVAV